MDDAILRLTMLVFLASIAWWNLQGIPDYWAQYGYGIAAAMFGAGLSGGMLLGSLAAEPPEDTKKGKR